MAEVTFYHQERVDGGRRSGLYADGVAILHGFVPGEIEHDPALAWYVDVTLDTPTPPTRANAQAWLNQRWGEYRAVLTDAANELSCGIDIDTIPWEFQRQSPDGPIRVSVSAMRRLTARHIGEKLNHLAGTEWTSLFPALVVLS
jgi:hypothetical protein